ncbi:MAG: EboA domain-containing protein [Endozoicomonas sp.]
MFFHNNDQCLKLYDALRKTCTVQQASWLKQALLDIAGTGGIEMHSLYSAMARRKMGEAPVYLPGTYAEAIGGAWFCSEAARTLMLKQLIDSHSPRQHRTLITNAYQAGDEYERDAILKGLSLLDPEGKLVELSIHFGRTNSLRLFSAIALLNPYAARHYSNSAFNQLVLKALSMDLDIRQITHLDQRRNQALNTMCLDYIEELQATDRAIPESITFAFSYHQLSDKEKVFLNHLNTELNASAPDNEPAY